MPKRSKSRKKRSLTQKFFLGLGKAVGWTIITTGKAIFYLGKGVWIGLSSLTRTSSRAIKRSSAKRTLKKQQPKAEPSFDELRTIKTKKGDFGSFHERLLNESLIVAVAGRRGSGKSVFGFRLLENIHAKTKRPCFVLGVKQSIIPEWIQSINSLEEVANRGLVLVDEGAVSFGSRNSMSAKNKKLGELLAVARHKDLTLVFVTQNTGMMDKNVLNLCDTLVFKEGSLLQEKMERSVMKDLYKSANESLKEVSPNDRKSYCYVVDGDFEGMLQVSLPSFWSSKVSKNQE